MIITASQITVFFLIFSRLIAVLLLTPGFSGKEIFSSGKMGFELAEAARKRGFEVTLVSGPVAIPCPEGIIYEKVETALEMREILVDLFPKSDLTIMSAAVSDHRPEFLGNNKIKKNRSLE